MPRKEEKTVESINVSPSSSFSSLSSFIACVIVSGTFQQSNEIACQISTRSIGMFLAFHLQGTQMISLIDLYQFTHYRKSAKDRPIQHENPLIALIIQSHKSDCVVPFREIPMVNPKRRSIYVESDARRRTRSSSSIYLTSRSQSLPKLAQCPSNETDFHLRNPSSRSSSPKSFSDHGLGSESTSSH